MNESQRIPAAVLAAIPPVEIETGELKCHGCGSPDLYKYDSRSRAWCKKCSFTDPLKLAKNPRKEPYIAGVKIGRNDLCWCNSGKKFKNCHMNMLK